jgi:hypothetical protein
MTITLTALGWVDEEPKGNRLRWHVPFDDPAAPPGLHLPSRILVERAPVDAPVPPANRGADAYPSFWWDERGDVPFAGLGMPFELPLASPVEAVRFSVLRPLRVVAQDSSGRVVVDLDAMAGPVDIQGSRIARVLVFVGSGTLHDVRTLDLSASRQLNFQPLVEMTVDASFGEPFESVQTRWAAPASITSSEWADVQDTVARARAGVAAQIDPRIELQFMLGVSWELAVLAGNGIADGPKLRQTDLDDILGAPLEALPPVGMAYRITDLDTGEASNIAIAPARLATRLTRPKPPRFADAITRVAVPKNGGPLTLRTTATLAWAGADPASDGIAFEEERSTATNSVLDRFDHRSRQPDDPPGGGTVPRVIEGTELLTGLRARAATVDGWGRRSGFSTFGPRVVPDFLHSPPPPPLESAASTGARTTVIRRSGWSADAFVAAARGEVVTLRRIAHPRQADVTVTTPLPIEGGYRTDVTGAPSLSDFIGGQLRSGTFSATVRTTTASSVELTVPESTGVGTVFSAGNARLTQSPSFSGSWMPVARFPATALPALLEFRDGVPADALTVEYAARLEWGGRIGRIGGAVTAPITRSRPDIPPRFTVAFLGSDVFERSVLAITFTSAPAQLSHRVWWGRGTLTEEVLGQEGGMGLWGAQLPRNRVLFDEIPIGRGPRPIALTIGVGATDELSGDGTLRIVTVDLPVA